MGRELLNCTETLAAQATNATDQCVVGPVELANMALDAGLMPVLKRAEFATCLLPKRPSSLPQLTEFGSAVDERTRNNLYIRA